nr:MAG TPA: hypothetical protein [Caudoviricetes sp.]DAF11238.1 MAG TPA: hypothetical protein [Caudoviricetes sp.]
MIYSILEFYYRLTVSGIINITFSSRCNIFTYPFIISFYMLGKWIIVIKHKWLATILNAYCFIW